MCLSHTRVLPLIFISNSFLGTQKWNYFKSPEFLPSNLRKQQKITFQVTLKIHTKHKKKKNSAEEILLPLKIHIPIVNEYFCYLIQLICLNAKEILTKSAHPDFCTAINWNISCYNKKGIFIAALSCPSSTNAIRYQKTCRQRKWQRKRQKKKNIYI